MLQNLIKVRPFLISTFNCASIEHIPSSKGPLFAEKEMFEFGYNSQKKLKFRKSPAREGVVQRPYDIF